MIYVVIGGARRLAINSLLTGWGRALRPHTTVLPYERLFRARKIQVGTYIFADLEMLSDAELVQAWSCWRALKACGRPLRLLNHPLRVMRRYELLRTLHERGLNDFNVYRLTEARPPQRYPVFIRGENDHLGAESDLLETPEALAAAIAALADAGRTRDGRIITEFNASRSSDGVYRKYGAFVLDGAIIPRHIIFSRDWVVKGKNRVVGDAQVEEELAYITDNPHAAALADICALAEIDYGRVDYDVVNGKIQVFEINTHPQILTHGLSRDPRRTHVKKLFAERFVGQFASLNSTAPPTPKIPSPIPRKPILKRRPAMVDILLGLNHALGLDRFEPTVHTHLDRIRSMWK
jgi:hypothetical protein